MANQPKKVMLTLEPLTDIGDLFTIEKFKASVRSGVFVQSNGFGYYVWRDKLTNIPVSIESFKKDEELTMFTHVMWYNK